MLFWLLFVRLQINMTFFVATCSVARLLEKLFISRSQPQKKTIQNRMPIKISKWMIFWNEVNNNFCFQIFDWNVRNSEVYFGSGGVWPHILEMIVFDKRNTMFFLEFRLFNFSYSNRFTRCNEFEVFPPKKNEEEEKQKNRKCLCVVMTMTSVKTFKWLSHSHTKSEFLCREQNESKTIEPWNSSINSSLSLSLCRCSTSVDWQKLEHTLHKQNPHRQIDSTSNNIIMKCFANAVFPTNCCCCCLLLFFDAIHNFII